MAPEDINKESAPQQTPAQEALSHGSASVLNLFVEAVGLKNANGTVLVSITSRNSGWKKTDSIVSVSSRSALKMQRCRCRFPITLETPSMSMQIF
jgi:hypothetical protein